MGGVIPLFQIKNKPKNQMNLSSVLLSLSAVDISDMLVESHTFRNAVSKFLLKNKSKKKISKGEKLIESLKAKIRKEFPEYSYNQKIPAIKFFRAFPFSLEQKNELKKRGVMNDNDIIPLFEAKQFIESL